MADTSPLRADLFRTATNAAAFHQERATAARQQADREREDRIENAAREFYLARTEHLQTLLHDAAANGQFEWTVWKFSPSTTKTEQDRATMRGLEKVADWLRERGIDADLQDAGGEDVPDLGYVHNVTLYARWAE